jgi:hypothetical protein
MNSILVKNRLDLRGNIKNNRLRQTPIFYFEHTPQKKVEPVKAWKFFIGCSFVLKLKTHDLYRGF